VRQNQSYNTNNNNTYDISKCITSSIFMQLHTLMHYYHVDAQPNRAILRVLKRSPRDQTCSSSVQLHTPTGSCPRAWLRVKHKQTFGSALITPRSARWD